MKLSMKIDKKKLYERLMILFGAIVSFIGLIISITIEDFSESFFPYFNVIVPVVNIISTVVCVFLLIYPKFRILQSMVVFVQGVVMVLNNLLFLGIFLYFLGVMLLFCNGYLRKKMALRLTCSFGVLFLSFTPIFFKNHHKYFMAVAFLLFVAFSFIYVYWKIKQNLFELFPFLANKISDKQMPETGGKLNLQDFELTDRQIKILKSYINGSTNYKDIGKIFYISESLVKKEMVNICKCFEVQSIEVLLFLLQQYELN